MDDQINDLQRQLNTLRQTQQEKQQRNYAATQVNNQAPPKNGERTSISKGASTNNTNTIDTSEVLDYISTAMATLSAFEK